MAPVCHDNQTNRDSQMTWIKKMMLMSLSSKGGIADKEAERLINSKWLLFKTSVIYYSIDHSNLSNKSNMQVVGWLLTMRNQGFLQIITTVMKESSSTSITSHRVLWRHRHGHRVWFKKFWIRFRILKDHWDLNHNRRMSLSNERIH